MSLNALSWAIDQCMGLGLSATDKMVLWQLADAHNIDNGAFVMQETIATRCEIGRATVNRSLDRLEACALIRRHARIHPVTKKQLPTRYFLAFEEGKAPQPLAGRVSKRDTGIRGPTGEEVGGDPVDNADLDDEAVSHSVSHSHETLTLEPINPLPPSEGLINTLIGKWDPVKAGSITKAGAAFDRLSAGEQRIAVDLADAFRGGSFALGRPLPALVTYLSKKLFEEFDGAPEIVGGRFRITPGRSEWSAWLGWVRRHNGQLGIDRVTRQGFLLVQTRHPDPLPAEEHA